MELPTPHPDQLLLLGVAIFQYLHKLEHVRSIHLFKKRGYIHSIQQEFFLSNGRSFKEMSAPTHFACFPSETHVKAHMDMVRAKQESESWKCVMDFCTSPPRNPHSQTTESLALDMLVVNVWAKANALFLNGDNRSPVIKWEEPHCILPSLFTRLQRYEQTKHEDHHMVIESLDTTYRSLQHDLRHEWGSDLELASPKISQAFDLSSIKNHRNDANMALYGATSSPMPSCLSTTNVDSSSWTQTPVVSAPIAPLNVMEESQLNCDIGRNFVYSLMSPNSEFESTLGESSSNCNIFGMMPFDYGITQPMSSTSNTYSSCEERSLKAVNSGTSDQLKDVWQRSNSLPKTKESIKSHKSKSAKAASKRLTELTKDELAHYFNMPITQASKELKVGLTVLKKRCRIFGIPRWPHRKMKSINSLINNIQIILPMMCMKDLTKGDQDTDSDASRVQVAVEELEKQKKEMQESPGIQLTERTKRLRQACFKASYRKRRQDLNDLSFNDHQNAATNSSYSNSSNNSSSSNSFYHYCK